MRTRSNFYPFNSTATIPRRSNRRRIPNIVEPEIRTIEEIVSTADRTMEKLLQEPTEGYGEAIVIPEILAENFEIKTNLLQLVQANKFHSFERDNPHTHISNFKRMTATLKYRDVPNDAIKLMLFPYSLEGSVRIWYEKKPPNSILTWDDLVNKFVNQFFPPSKTTHLKNEISRFTQRFEETFREAWDRFKEMLRACPHHGFSELTQIDTLYNSLTEQDQDSLNAAAGDSNLIEIVNKQVIAPAKAVEKTCVTCGGAHAYYDCIATDSNQPSVCASTGSYNQVSPPNRASHQILPPGFAPVQNNPNRYNQGCQNQPFSVPNNQIQQSVPYEFSSYMKSNEIMIKSMQNQINVLKGDFNKQEENLRRNFNNDMRSILGSFFQNQPSTSSTLPSNIVPNPKGEMKVVTTRSGLACEGPSIPTNSPLEKVVEQNTEEILDKEHSDCPGSTAQVQPPVVPISIPEPDVPRTQMKPTILYPSRLNDRKLWEKATNQMEKFFQIFHDLHFDISFADALLLMPKFASTIKSLLANKDKLFELAKVPLNENCSAMLLKKLPEKLGDPGGEFHFPTDFEADPRVPLIIWRSFLRTGRALIDVYGEEITLRYNPKSSSPTLISDSSIPENDFSKEPIVKSSSPTLTPFGESDFFLEEIKDFLNDDSIPTGIENYVYDPEGDILFLEKLLSEDPFQLPSMDLKLAEESKAKSFVEEPPELELKELPSHIEYALLEDSNKLPVIIAKNLKDIEKEALINVLKSHKWAIAWKISDIKGINPRFCTHKILMEDDYKPAVQSQRRVNPKIHDVIKKEVIKLLDAGMIYPISGSPWVSPIHCVPQKGGMTAVANENNELIPTRLLSVGEEGIVLGHKISMPGIEVDSTKVDVIAKLPHPTTIKGVRSFLGHVGFYRRFIQDFSKITRPMTHLLEKETPFVFSKECIDAFNTLKKKLAKAPILVVLDWNLPFELMCDANDYAIGAVLGQRKTKHFQPIHYASKKMTEAQIHYTTAEKEMLTVLLKSSNLSMRDLLGAIMVSISQRRSDRGIHFCNDQFTRVMVKYGVTHRLATTYHPQTSGQVEVSNHGLKRILERTVGKNYASWAYWALKHVNFDLKTAGDHRKLQLNELSKLRDQAYENSVIYKERTKKLHDFKIKNRIFNVGDQVLLFNSRLKIFSGKLKTRWSMLEIKKQLLVNYFSKVKGLVLLI
uniref:Integrase catalytic domain-containing protein n=1 Tax=Tanacetum cinerariifolium TaxID=118510 RepID=A0A6L2LAY7_TANCI|nr:hypothetical protein [Tanacetum cinerariifolium]